MNLIQREIQVSPEMFGDIHRVALKSLLCCLGCVLKDIVQSEVLVFSQCLPFSVLDSGFHQPRPISTSHLTKNTPKHNAGHSARKLRWSDAMAAELLELYHLHITGWPGKSPGSSKLPNCSGNPLNLCLADLWGLEADFLTSWLGFYSHMHCQLWHLTLKSIIPNHM